MAEKILSSRIVHKHDVAANWSKATGFTPRAGELIVYDIDADYTYERIKIGDGVRNVNTLPFVDDALRATLVEQINVVDDKVDAVSTLVGDTSVAEQINTAVANSQSDWSVNDETSPAYIKNRAFWESDHELLYSARLTVTDIGGMYGVMDQSDAAKSFAAEHGTIYTVVVDGVTYSCVCDGSYIGNKNLLSSNFNDTEEPFLMICSGETGLAFVTSDTSTATYDVEIYGPFVKTIDWKYLPEFEYVTAAEGDSRWASEMQFRRINGRLTYKGKTYETNYKYFMYFLTDAGLWSIGLVAGGIQIPSTSEFRMNYDSSDGTLSFYWMQEAETTEIETTMNANLRNPTTGEIISRHTGVSTLTIGTYTKKSHNIPFYINKTNPQDELVVSDFNDFVEIPVPTTTDNGKVLGVVDGSLNMVGLPAIDEALSNTSTNAVQNKVVNAAITNLNTLVGDTPVSEQIAAANIIHVGPTEPTDPNIQVWINTAEESTGIIPVLPRIATVTLAASSWTGSASPYSQVVDIATVTSATKIDLQPTVAQIVALQNDDIALMAQNDNGVVTIYSFGGKPSADMTMQVQLMEVSYV